MILGIGMQLIMLAVLFSWLIVILVVLVADIWRVKRAWPMWGKLLASLAVFYVELMLIILCFAYSKSFYWVGGALK